MISYPITIVPVYNALEAVIGKKETCKDGEGEDDEGVVEHLWNPNKTNSY